MNGFVQNSDGQTTNENVKRIVITEEELDEQIMKSGIIVKKENKENN